jgi:hypothetical protein
MKRSSRNAIRELWLFTRFIKKLYWQPVINKRSRGGVALTVYWLGCRLDDSWCESLQGQNIFFSGTSRQTGSGVHPASSSICIGVHCFPSLKWPRRKFDHVRLSVAKIKNWWSYISIPHAAKLHSLRGVDRDNWNFSPFSLKHLTTTTTTTTSSHALYFDNHVTHLDITFKDSAYPATVTQNIRLS